MIVNLAVTAGLVLVLMLGAFAVGVRRRRHDGVDVVWGLGFVLIGAVTAVLADGPVWRRALVTALVAVWGLRLAWHIGRRNHGQPEDRRYVALLARAPGNHNVYALYSVYLLQGAVMWVVSLPVQYAQYGDDSTWVSWGTVPFGVALWLVGFVFEAVGDAQLARFTADPANREGARHRPLAVHPAPQLFRRHVRLVGVFCTGVPWLARACNSRGSGSDYVPSHPGHR